MKRGSRRNYKFGQKNNWRRTVWNDVLRRTDGREKTEAIIYLPGAQDLDREVALSKGVPEHNLFAVDIAKRNIDSVRSDGGFAIKSDIIDLLWSWPKDKPVAAVLLDFCCGLEWWNLGVFDAFQHKPLRRAVVMVNFQRGRDPFFNDKREMLKKAGILMPLWKGNMETDEVDPEPIVSDMRNRAYQFLLFHAAETASILLTGEGTMERADQDGVKDWRDKTRKEALAYAPLGHPAHDWYLAQVSLAISSYKARFFSYQSGNLMFDSAVYSSPFRHYDDLRFKEWVEKFWPGRSWAESEAAINRRQEAWKEMPIVRRIAATMATRTMRMFR